MGDKKDVAKELKILFASNFSAYIKCLGYHCNVRGHKFYEEHEMWKEIYKYLEKSNQKIANQIAWLDQVVPASIDRVQELTEVKDDDEVPDYVGMAKTGYEAMEICRAQAEKVISMSDDLGWPGMSDWLTAYCRHMNKYMFWCNASTEVVDTHPEDGKNAEGKDATWSEEPL
jgi:DNA-binding ferritin-like protein